MIVATDRPTYKVVVDGQNALLLPKTQLEWDGFRELITQSNRFAGRASGVITQTPAIMYLNSVMVSNIESIRRFCEGLATVGGVVSHAYATIAPVKTMPVKDGLAFIGENINAVSEALRQLGNASRLPVAIPFDLNVEFKLPATTAELDHLLHQNASGTSSTTLLLAAGLAFYFLTRKGGR